MKLRFRWDVMPITGLLSLGDLGEGSFEMPAEYIQVRTPQAPPSSAQAPAASSPAQTTQQAAHGAADEATQDGSQEEGEEEEGAREEQ